MLLLSLLGLLAPASAQSTEIGANPFGLGVMAGDPTGLSGKLYLGGRTNAIDMALAFDTYGDETGWLYFHATYLWHPSVLASGSGVEVPWHVGVGGYLKVGDWERDRDERLGVRVPIGIDVDLTAIPLQFFADLALHVDIVPGTDLDFGAGVGARYYF